MIGLLNNFSSLIAMNETEMDIQKDNCVLETKGEINMKNIVLVIGLVLASNFLAFFQKAKKAPFGGKLIDESQNIVFNLRT